MIKTKFEISDNSIKCSSCEKDGHKLESVIVKVENGYRTSKFCICCGTSSIWHKLNCVDENKCKFDYSSQLLKTKNL